MAPASDTDLIPPALAAQIQAAADAEHRPAVDRRVAFKTEDLSDAELANLTEGGMDPRHDHLNAELE